MRWSKARTRALLATAAAVAVLAPVGWFWQDSLLPDRYAVTSMGAADYGGGPDGMAHGMHHGGMGAGMHMGAGGRSVATLTGAATGRADVRVTLTARHQRHRLPSGQWVDGLTLNGVSPGPTIRAREGQVVEVRLRNESVPDGVTLHWHGLDVPNAMDGVAGVTQDAVGIGKSFTYRFTANQVGTYWYHSHQMSHTEVPAGLLGAVVITPRHPEDDIVDTVALVHLYDGIRTINGRPGDVPLTAPPGRRVRARVINTDNGPMPVWVTGAPFEVAAVDGTDVNRPDTVSGRNVLVTAGGRVDLEFTVPTAGVRVEMGGSAALVAGHIAPSREPTQAVDLLTYGKPAPLTFDPDKPDRRFDYAIGRRPGFLRGKPGMWWTVNGKGFPDMPMFVVADGDVVRMHISNDSGDVHPMHPHGHHMLVLARNGKRATGSPWWVDSLNVADGESYDVAFVADNPGIWLFHCHNLGHAAQGFVAHLMYEGVRSPYLIGHGNDPE